MQDRKPGKNRKRCWRNSVRTSKLNWIIGLNSDVKALLVYKPGKIKKTQSKLTRFRSRYSFRIVAEFLYTEITPNQEKFEEQERGITMSSWSHEWIWSKNCRSKGAFTNLTTSYFQLNAILKIQKEATKISGGYSHGRGNPSDAASLMPCGVVQRKVTNIWCPLRVYCFINTWIIMNEDTIVFLPYLT